MARAARVVAVSESAVQRMVQMCRDARPEQITAGILWYRLHGNAIIAEGAKAGLNREQSLAIFACLSPKCRIGDNWTKYRYVLQDKNTLRVWYATGVMKRKVAAVLSGNYDLAWVLSGDKVHAFYHNLDGDETLVTVDTWAADIVDNGRIKRPSLKGYAYQCYAAPYKLVAAVLGYSNAATQAVLWLVWREMQGYHDDGGVPLLP
jgi:hypothetical protein